MKDKKKFRPFFHVFLLLALVLFLAAAVVGGLIFYIFYIPEPEGLSLAAWPGWFTENFQIWMESERGKIRVKENGLERLDAYDLWLQVIDEEGQEVFSYNKPEEYPVSYTASALMKLGAGSYENGYTVFVGDYADAGESWSYLVGFPYAIGRSIVYYNGENVARLSPIFYRGLQIFLGAVIFLVLGYGLWLTRHLDRIADGIRMLSRGSYMPSGEKGFFRDIYEALNRTDKKLKEGEAAKAEADRARREWIANITHDLKTPLSPVKGYAELLAAGAASEPETVRAYGSVILKNIDHVEQLINDLKLTYQLDAGVVPFHPQEMRLERFVREIVIDIINDPLFCRRDIAFRGDGEENTVLLDPELLRRAIQNLVINALVHNPPDTKVWIDVETVPGGHARILIRDNGKGLGEARLQRLFERYYRGTNTKKKPEGTGLGLAIARQIVELHGGTVAAAGREGGGTEFTVFLPVDGLVGQ